MHQKRLTQHTTLHYITEVKLKQCSQIFAYFVISNCDDSFLECHPLHPFIAFSSISIPVFFKSNLSQQVTFRIKVLDVNSHGSYLSNYWVVIPIVAEAPSGEMSSPCPIAAIIRLRAAIYAFTLDTIMSVSAP